MSEVCIHCESVLKNKSILVNHLKNNKKCLALRGLSVNTEFVCEGCNIMCVATTHLKNHKDKCKEYQKIINLKEQENEFKEKEKEQENEYKEKLREQEIKYNILNTSLESIQKQYIESKEEYKHQIEKLQDRIEKLQDQISSIAKEAVSRPTTTNNTINHIRNNLSSKYTLDELKDAEILDICRENLTEQIFMSGHKAIAKMCTEKIINTKDEKKMLCCTDTSRKKFKYIDKTGNLKEDIEARIFVDRVSKPIKDVGKKIYENIMEDLSVQREKVREEDYGKKERLTTQSFQVMDRYKDIINIDDSKYNNNFTNELAILNKTNEIP